MTTGLAGSITTFSGWMVDSFLYFVGQAAPFHSVFQNVITFYNPQIEVRLDFNWFNELGCDIRYLISRIPFWPIPCDFVYDLI